MEDRTSGRRRSRRKCTTVNYAESGEEDAMKPRPRRGRPPKKRPGKRAKRSNATYERGIPTSARAKRVRRVPSKEHTDAAEIQYRTYHEHTPRSIRKSVEKRKQRDAALSVSSMKRLKDTVGSLRGFRTSSLEGLVDALLHAYLLLREEDEDDESSESLEGTRIVRPPSVETYAKMSNSCRLRFSKNKSVNLALTPQWFERILKTVLSSAPLYFSSSETDEESNASMSLRASIARLEALDLVIVVDRNSDTASTSIAKKQPPPTELRRSLRIRTYVGDSDAFDRCYFTFGSRQRMRIDHDVTCDLYEVSRFWIETMRVYMHYETIGNRAAVLNTLRSADAWGGIANESAEYDREEWEEEEEEHCTISRERRLAEMWTTLERSQQLGTESTPSRETNRSGLGVSDDTEIDLLLRTIDRVTRRAVLDNVPLCLHEGWWHMHRKRIERTARRYAIPRRRKTLSHQIRSLCVSRHVSWHDVALASHYREFALQEGGSEDDPFSSDSSFLISAITRCRLLFDTASLSSESATRNRRDRLCRIVALFTPWDDDVEDGEEEEREPREIDALANVLDDAICLCAHEYDTASRRGRKPSVRDGLRAPKTASATDTAVARADESSDIYRACAFVRLWTDGLLEGPMSGRAFRDVQGRATSTVSGKSDLSRIFSVRTQRWPTFLFKDGEGEGEEERDRSILSDLAFSSVEQLLKTLNDRPKLYDRIIETFARGKLSFSFTWDKEKKECYLDAASAKCNRTALVPLLHVQGKIVAASDGGEVDNAIVDRESSAYYFEHFGDTNGEGDDQMGSIDFPGGYVVLERLKRVLMFVLQKIPFVRELELFRIVHVFGRGLLRYALRRCPGVRCCRIGGVAYWKLDIKA